MPANCLQTKTAPSNGKIKIDFIKIFRVKIIYLEATIMLASISPFKMIGRVKWHKLTSPIQRHSFDNLSLNVNRRKGKIPVLNLKVNKFKIPSHLQPTNDVNENYSTTLVSLACLQQ